MHSGVLLAAAARIVSVNCLMISCIKTLPPKTRRTRRKNRPSAIAEDETGVASETALAFFLCDLCVRIYFGFLCVLRVLCGSVLETRQVGKLLLSGVHMHAAELGAARECGHRLAGIEQRVLVECGFHAPEGCEFRGAELEAHIVDLLDADTVLAGDGTADLDRKLEDLATERFRAFEFAWRVGVVEDHRVQIAVAGMKHVGATQPVLFFHFGDAAQHLADALARNRAVHAVIVGRDASDRGKRGLASGPESEPVSY